MEYKFKIKNEIGTITKIMEFLFDVEIEEFHINSVFDYQEVHLKTKDNIDNIINQILNQNFIINNK